MKEIKEDKDINFRYISTTENPADLASRGTSTLGLLENRLWWHGPGWTTKSRYDWPMWKCDYSEEKKDKIRKQTEEEFRQAEVMFEAKLIAGEAPPVDKLVDETSFDLDPYKYSSLKRMWRVTALVLRFLDRLRRKTSWNGPLDAVEISHADKMWTAYIQKTKYSDVIDCIQKKRSNYTYLVIQLGLYLDSDRLLRCRGRLENAEVCDDARHPLLLPTQHRYTDLLIQMHYKASLHTDCAHTLSLIRQKYWIPQGRLSVKKVLKRCTLCGRHEGVPYKMPLMPPIPTERVSVAVPFTNTGVDYFGPLYIKVKRGTQKVWVCLYTCLTTRAVHLELMQDMSTEQFLLGFRRFVAQHGKPNKSFQTMLRNPNLLQIQWISYGDKF